MTYCSLEEAWGSDFSSSKYFEKINQQPQQQQQPLIQQSTVPPNPPENMRTYPKVNNQETGLLIKLIATNQVILRNPVSDSSTSVIYSLS